MMSCLDGYIVNEKADIKKIGNKVVVIDKYGNQCFARPYTNENISLAHDIYIGCKYEEIKKENA